MIPIAPNIAMGVANAPGVRPFLNTLIAGQRPEILREAGEAFAEMPYGFSAPVSAGTQTIQSILDTPRSSEELLANYGYREQPIQPDEPLVGPELSEMQRRYAQQRLRQVSAAEGEEMVQVQKAANPSAINLKEEGKFDPVTRTYLLPDGTRVPADAIERTNFQLQLCDAALQARGLKKGLATLCIGGGEATAVALELV
jgi:hypothetical protein